jgi:hypothetical protein
LVAEINLQLTRWCSTPIADAFVSKYLENLEIQPLVTKTKYSKLNACCSKLVEWLLYADPRYGMPMQKRVGLWLDNNRLKIKKCRSPSWITVNPRLSGC